MKRLHKVRQELGPNFKDFKFEPIRFGVDNFIQGNFRKVFETERFQEHYYTNFKIGNSKFTLYFFTKTKSVSITHYNTQQFHSFRCINPQLHALYFNQILYLMNEFSLRYNTNIRFLLQKSEHAMINYNLSLSSTFKEFCIQSNLIERISFE